VVTALGTPELVVSLLSLLLLLSQTFAPLVLVKIAEYKEKVLDKLRNFPETLPRSCYPILSIAKFLN